jgi:hypothetical protein
MEIEQVAEENPVRNTIWIKIAIALLALMSIGQISAMFLPALTGVSPKPISMLGSILWPGLLLMTTWSLRSKKKLNGFMLGALVGFIFYFFAGVTAGYLKAEERSIDQAVATSNEGLPKMIDEETRLDSIAIDQTSKNYSLNMSLVNLAQSEIDVDVIHEIFETSIKPTSCGNESFKVFFSEGYKINYVYKDKTGLTVAKYTVNPTDCQ